MIEDIGYVFASQVTHGDTDRVKTEWHHYAAVYDLGEFTLWVDGEAVVTALFGEQPTLRGENTVFTIGGSIYTLDVGAAAISSRTDRCFHGEMDDFIMYSKSLTQTEIQALMACPLDTSSQLDGDVVLYYNFDVECDLSDVDNCDIIGATGEVTNHGSAGSDYNLLVGMMNDDAGFGTYYHDVNDEADVKPAIPFDKPFPVQSSVPVVAAASEEPDFAAVPFVLHAKTYETLPCPMPVVVEDVLNTPWTLTALPSKGDVVLTSTGAVLGLNAEVGTRSADGASVFHFLAATLSSPVKFSITATNTAGVALVFDYHIWPVSNPTSTKAVIVTNTIEDKSVTIYFDLFAVEKSSDRVIYEIFSLPAKGQLTDAGGAGVITITENGTNLRQTAVVYTPDQDGYSSSLFDSFSIRFMSATFGLYSDPVTVNIMVDNVNDLPSVEDVSSRIDEDDTDGVIIHLPVMDPDSSPGIAISQLPEKGDVYLLDGEGNRTLKVDSPYQLYDLGNVMDQYVTEVRSVSSFWGAPPALGTFAFN